MKHNPKKNLINQEMQNIKMEKENKMDRLKERFVKIQGKIQDRVEGFQDRVEKKIEQSRLSRFVSHLSSDRSVDSSSREDDGSSMDKISIGSNDILEKAIPSFVVDEPNDVDPAKVCEDFIKMEKNSVLYGRRSLSATNLAFDENFEDSSDSCVSCMSYSDERYLFNVSFALYFNLLHY